MLCWISPINHKLNWAGNLSLRQTFIFGYKKSPVKNNTGQAIVPCINKRNVCTGKKTKDSKREEGGVHPDKGHEECKLLRNWTEEESKTQDGQAPEGGNRLLQPCSAFPGVPIHFLLVSPVPGDAMAVPASSSFSKCLWQGPSPIWLLARLGLLTGPVTSPGSWDAAQQGGHGHPLAPPIAWLPGAKVHLDLAAPRRGCSNLPVYGG